MKRIVGTIVIAGALAAFAYTADARQAGVRGTIEAANQKFVMLFEKRDAAALASLYTTDGEAYPPSADVVRGREAIQKMWQGVMDAGVASAKLTTRDVESSGDLATESGNYEMIGKDGASLDRGKYVVVWKRMQGQWLIHRDIWNTNQPAMH